MPSRQEVERASHPLSPERPAAERGQILSWGQRRNARATEGETHRSGQAARTTCLIMN